MSRAIVGPEADAIVGEIEAIYAGGGPAPRSVEVVRDARGGERLRIGGLFIECVVCGMRVPQSRSRASPEARRQWVALHLRCPE